jgi:uncharacterized protein YgiM (DUF1202 family)
MALQDKYQELISAANAAGVSNLNVVEQGGVLHIDGVAPNGNAKDQLWDIFGRIDPNFATGDLILNVNVAPDATVTKVKVTTESSNLNIRKGPGTDQPIVGKAAHGEIITLVSQSNPQWWLVRTDDGEEGYAYTQFLTPQG